MAEQLIVLYPNKDYLATHGAYFQREDGSIRKVQNARVLVLAYDNNRSLEPDLHSLKWTYTNFGWPMLVLKNFDKDPLLAFLSSEENFVKHMQLQNGDAVDLLMVHILAHGDAGGLFATHKKKFILKEDVHKSLSCFNCLQGSRKIFLMGPCRGGDMEMRFEAGSSVVPRNNSASEKPPFIKYDAAEPNTMFFFSTLEGYLSLNDSCEGTFLVKSWCDRLQSLNTDTSLEALVVDTSMAVCKKACENADITEDEPWPMFLQTPIMHFSSSRSRLFFAPLDYEPTCQSLEGWYSNLNNNLSKKAPGRVYIFFDPAHSNLAQLLDQCFASRFPHLKLCSTLVSGEVKVPDEIKNIAKVLDLEYVVHFFFLTQVEREGAEITLPKFGGANVDLLIKTFTVDRCPKMCGKPKAFYVLDCLLTTDDLAVELKPEIVSYTGQNHSDFLCLIAKGQDVVQKLVEALDTQSQALIDEKTHLLELLPDLVNSLNPSDFAPLVISTLRCRLSLQKVDSPYIEPILRDEKFNRITFAQISHGILEILLRQDKKRAYLVCSEAGTGKTRFSEEICRQLKHKRVSVVHIRAKEHESLFSFEGDLQDIFRSVSDDGKMVDPEKSALVLDAIDEICPRKRATILSFLAKAVDKFLFVLATSRTQEEQEIAKVLKKSDVSVFKLLDWTNFQVQEFMRIHLSDVPSGLASWRSLQSEINFVWTPQLLKLIAKYIRAETEKDQNVLSQGLRFSNKFHFYWTIFNQHLNDSKRTLPNLDLLYFKMVHLKLAICNLTANKPLKLSPEDEEIVLRVGLANFRYGKVLTFSHQSWSEFLVCLALISSRGMMDGSFSSEEKAEVLINRDCAVLEFLNQAFGVDLEDDHFAAGNFLKDESLVEHFRESGKAFSLGDTICRVNYRNLYYGYVVEKLPEILSGSLEERNKLLLSACATKDLYNKNGGEEAGDIALDLMDQRGADLNQMFKDLQGFNNKEGLVQSLARSNNCRVLQRLESKISQEILDEALLVAAQYGQVEVMQVLISKDANLNRNKMGGCVLHCAAFFGMRHVFEFLLKEQKMDINLISELEGKTPLHSTVQGGQLDMVQWLLLQPQTDVCALDHKRLNALHQAVLTGDPEIVQLLLEDNRLNVDIKNLLGDSPLHMSCGGWQEQKEIVELLLQKGANSWAPNDKGASPLHLAAHRGHLEVVRRLLKERKVQVDGSTTKGRTALHLAAAGGHPKVVDLLLRARAKVNVVDLEGNTALHKAAALGDFCTVERLLGEPGVDLEARNRRGQLAEECAQTQVPGNFRSFKRGRVQRLLNSKRMQNLN